MTGQGFLAAADGTKLAFARTPGRAPTIVFLGGFRSNMTGTKASYLDAWCRERGQGFLRFDYAGHGASAGRFEDGTIGRWATDAIAVIDALTEDDLVLVGSSMGGWIMLEVALSRPGRVAALVGIAAAPDFTEDLIWDAWPEAKRARLLRDGVVVEPSTYDQGGYPITRALIEDGRTRLRLRGNIAFAGPVRLLHGMRDAEVPWRTSLRLAEALEVDDVRLLLAKDGDHRLSRAPDLALLGAVLGELVGLDRGQDGAKPLAE
ncbi:MAG: alpha/beta hydrolase [Acetobacteraceae bacterium]|nr:alpha/beta hydrolase [Acetobacteraceae bacterium]